MTEKLSLREILNKLAAGPRSFGVQDDHPSLKLRPARPTRPRQLAGLNNPETSLKQIQPDIVQDFQDNV